MSRRGFDPADVRKGGWRRWRDSAEIGVGAGGSGGPGLRPFVYPADAAPEARGEAGVDVGQEGGELGEGELEHLGGHPGVLGGVEGAAALGDQSVEAIEEGEGG